VTTPKCSSIVESATTSILVLMIHLRKPLIFVKPPAKVLPQVGISASPSSALIKALLFGVEPTGMVFRVVVSWWWLFSQVFHDEVDVRLDQELSEED
jgi:hypothetical protein